MGWYIYTYSEEEVENMPVVTREVTGNLFPRSVISLLFSEHPLVFFSTILIINLKGFTLSFDSKAPD